MRKNREELPSESQGETVLVVEDNEDARSYIVDCLRELNYRVLSSANAESALKHIENPNVRIDLMLTDVVMPGMNGRQLAEKAETLRPELKIIYMSGYSHNALIHGDRVDANMTLLVKPITQSALANHIRESLDSGRG